MRSTQFFLPTLRENPTEAQIVSHRLMLRAGMVRQTAAGIYSWLRSPPIGPVSAAIGIAFKPMRAKVRR